MHSTLTLPAALAAAMLALAAPAAAGTGDIERCDIGAIVDLSPLGNAGLCCEYVPWAGAYACSETLPIVDGTQGAGAEAAIAPQGPDATVPVVCVWVFGQEVVCAGGA